MKQRLPLVIGNWKMNPATRAEARKLFIGVRQALRRKNLHTDIAIAAPFVFIADIASYSPSNRIQLSAQNVSAEAIGAYTGEIAVAMLKSFGVSSVILGHSERRASGETDAAVVAKLETVLKAGLTAVVCVGEEKRDSAGHYFTVVEKQLHHILKSVKRTQLERLVIAYEPIWAIGTGATATPEDAHEMKLFIQKIIADTCSRAAIAKVRILYGGSVKAANAADLLNDGNVDGFLVGGASLKPKEFVDIVQAASEYGKH